MGGDNQLTGTIEVEAGELYLTSPHALGKANVIVHPGASLIAEMPLKLSPEQSITGDGKISLPKRSPAGGN